MNLDDLKDKALGHEIVSWIRSPMARKRDYAVQENEINSSVNFLKKKNY